MTMRSVRREIGDSSGGTVGGEGIYTPPSRETVPRNIDVTVETAVGVHQLHHLTAIPFHLHLHIRIATYTCRGIVMIP